MPCRGSCRKSTEPSVTTYPRECVTARPRVMPPSTYGRFRPGAKAIKGRKTGFAEKWIAGAKMDRPTIALLRYRHINAIVVFPGGSPEHAIRSSGDIQTPLLALLRPVAPERWRIRASRRSKASALARTTQACLPKMTHPTAPYRIKARPEICPTTARTIEEARTPSTSDTLRHNVFAG